MKKRHSHLSAGLGAAACLAVGAIVGGTVFAQESDETAGGLRLTLGISGTLRADDNPDLSFGDKNATVFQDTRLSFGLINETAVDTLQINLNTGLRLLNESQGGFDASIDDPRVSFSYARQGVNSSFGVTANARQTRLEFFDPLVVPDPVEGEPTDSTDLILSTGTRLSYNLGSTLELGLNDPLGLRLEARHQQRDYNDVTDPDLFDTTTNTLSATLRYDLSPVLSTRLRLSNQQYSAADTLDTERQTQEYTFGAALDLTKTLVLDVSLGATRITTDETIASLRQSREQNGTNASASLVQEMTNGTVAFSFIRSFGVNDARDSVEISRQLDLPRGSLEAAFGATRGDEGNTEATLRLAYVQDLARGSVSASVRRNVSTNTLNEDVLTTQASLGYQTDLTAISSLSLGLDYIRTADGGSGAATDQERATLRASYSRDLTEDVALTAGYQHRLSNEDSDQANSNSVFVTISRKFNLRP